MILTILGTRPQYIKACMVSKALADRKIKEIIIDTNQHYNDDVNKAIVNSLPYTLKPKRVTLFCSNLQELAIATEKKTKPYIQKAKAVVLYGDTNSTLVGALIASKYKKPIIHIEAGERSGNLEMPEERNRISVDLLSSLCLCVNKKGYNNIKGLVGTQKKIVGDVMLDTLLGTKEKYEIDNIKESFYLFTLHRLENTKDLNHISEVLNILAKLKKSILWPIHPRLNETVSKLNVPSNVKVVKPLSYRDSIYTVSKAECVITDSGGLQKEAYWLKTKCITLRNETEWTETLVGNWNMLLKNNQLKDLPMALKAKPNPQSWNLKQFGNGKAAINVANIIASFINE